MRAGDVSAEEARSGPDPSGAAVEGRIRRTQAIPVRASIFKSAQDRTNAGSRIAHPIGRPDAVEAPAQALQHVLTQAVTVARGGS